MGLKRGAKRTTTTIAAWCLPLVLCMAGCAGSGDVPTPAPAPAPLPVLQPAGPRSAEPTATAGPVEAATVLPDAGDSSGLSVYFVAIGDAGARGIRFGCDDSLVAVPLTPASGSDPLATAMNQLLAPGNTATGNNATQAGLYNALSGSTLRYVSGYLDGSTVVVNLSGPLRPGGVCDHPRIETQLTQTAVAATGASQAEIYIDGNDLSNVLSLR